MPRPAQNRCLSGVAQAAPVWEHAEVSGAALSPVSPSLPPKASFKEEAKVKNE